MNEKKICFIWNVQDEKYYTESRKYIECLHIPDSYEVETLQVNDNNYARAYNYAMRSTDAKYKIYLYDSTFIINKNFIRDMLLAFENKKIGMFGILGSKTIPTNGVWRDSKHQCGKQYVDNGKKIECVCFQDGQRNGEEIKALDGILLATQYDITWREELFSDKYYYDMAQGIEFKRAGYEITVADQDSPWVLYECIYNNDKKEFEKAKEKFLEEYSEDIYPLVSILIPTYNRPEYFKIALESALKQTYKNIEIVIGDNSENNDTQKMIQPYLKQYSRIIYINNGGNIGMQSFYNIFSRSKGAFINYLMDDDFFHEDKICAMMNYYIEYPHVSLVTSYRQLVDQNGNFLPERAATQKIVVQDSIIKGDELARGMLFNTLNFIGEPTTVLIKREFFSQNSFGTFLNRKYKMLTDIAQWLEMLRQGDGVYITKALSYFRQHEGQEQHRDSVKFLGAIDRFNYLYDCYKAHLFIYSEEEFVYLLNLWYQDGKKYLEDINILKDDERVSLKDISEYLKCLNRAKEILHIF